MKQKIEAIETKYGEYVFICALNQLIYSGAQKLKELDVEAEIRHINENTSNHAIMAPEMQISILRCSVELANCEPRAILAYVQMSCQFGDVTNHPGKLVRFKRADTNREVSMAVLPADTDANTMDELQACLDASSPEAENVSAAQYVTNCLDKVIGTTGWRSQFAPDVTLFF